MVAPLLRTYWALAQDILMLEVEGPGFVLMSPDRSINNDNLERKRTVERILTRGRFEWRGKYYLMSDDDRATRGRFEWRGKYYLTMSDGDRASDMDQFIVLCKTWGM